MISKLRLESLRRNPIQCLFNGLMVIALQIVAQPEPLQLRQFTSDEGLSSSTVTCFLQDHYGFMWIGTYNGLNRYDGFQFDIYQHHPLDSTSIGHNRIWTIFEDSRNNLYIGTSNGLSLYDRNHDNFYNLMLDSTSALCNKKCILRSIAEDILGNLWLTTESGLIYYDRCNNQIDCYASDPNDPKNFSDIYKEHVLTDSTHHIRNETEATLNNTITLPFWKTCWFRIVLFLMAGMALIGMHGYLIWRVKNQKHNLKMLIPKRMADLEQSNLELEQFAYAASHDLQEPLRMIGTYAGLLERKLQGKLDKDGQEFFFYMIDGAKRMQLLINDLLIFSRLSTQANPFENTNLNTIINHVLINLKVVIEKHEAMITFDSLPSVMCDKRQVERLFQNIIDNSIKYCKTRPKIHISVSQNNNLYQFSIQDNGIGVDPKFKDKIFTIFQRLHHRNEYSGTGIGLAVCKKIVKRHGGEIWVESEGEGKSSTFIFTIPVEFQSP